MMMGFTFRNQHSSDFGIISKTIENPVKPALRVDKVRVLGKDGSIKFEDGFEDRVIEFECVIKANSLYELEANLKNIALWVSQKGPLTLDYAPNDTFEAKVYEKISPQRYPKYYVFDLVFECDS